MAIIYGVDSKKPANAQLQNGYQLYSWVMRQNGFPAFWARSISGENKLTPEEVEFLRSKKCRIALVLDDLTEIGIASVDGTEDAMRAVDAAKALGVPAHQGIALFASINPNWSVSHNWMISFANVLSANGYVPGFIGNTDSSKNSNFDRHCSHFVRATGEVGHYGAVYWATEPKQSGEPTEWAPYCPSALKSDDVSLWQRGKIDLPGLAVNVDYARNESKLDYMW